MATDTATPKRKTAVPDEAWKQSCYKDHLTGKYSINALATMYGKDWHIVDSAMKKIAASIVVLSDDVVQARQRYIDRLLYCEALAEELWETGKGNAKAAGLKSLIVCAKEIGAAMGVSVTHIAVENDDVSTLIRKLLDGPSLAEKERLDRARGRREVCGPNKWRDADGVIWDNEWPQEDEVPADEAKLLPQGKEEAGRTAN